jgi:release factor glutamine methyltransferase
VTPTAARPTSPATTSPATTSPATTPPATTPPAVTRGALVHELTGLLGGARHEARFIVDEVLGATAAGSDSAGVAPEAASAARAMAARRQAGEPLQYLFGHWPFRRLDVVVDPRVLIPRPETEQLVEVALGEVWRLRGGPGEGAVGLLAIDAGTGSGAIALALATELAGSRVWATDTSPDALAVAAVNLERVRADHPEVAVELVEGSWLQPLRPDLRGRVQLVVSNPPYVSEAEWAGLPAEVRAEPRRALVARAGSDGTPGLADVEAVLAQALDWLDRPGCAVVELAPHQADAAAGLALALGYDEVRVEPDLAGLPRALVAGLAR